VDICTSSTITGVAAAAPLNTALPSASAVDLVHIKHVMRFVMISYKN
jgi:hypothetical protein